LRNFCNFTS